MSQKFNVKESFHWLVGIATIVSCVFTLIGVTKVVLLVVEVRPIVKEIQRQQDTILKLQRDTVKIWVRDTITIVRTDTIPKYGPKPASDPMDKIIEGEDDFRRRHSDIFN